MSGITIAGRAIGPNHQPFVIAEIGVNHNGDPALARQLLDAAIDAGADAVKLQAFEAGLLATAGAERAGYQRAAGDSSQLEMLRALELPVAAWADLAAHARERGIIFLATPFDEPSVELLSSIDVPAFKVGSGDLTNALLLRAVGRHRLPVILSTGMGTMDDVAAGVAELQRAGADQVALLHCASVYPAQVEDVNLRAMDSLRDRFGDPVGFSDHTTGAVAAVAAVARGAAIIEKHLTLDRSMTGPDHAASMEPDAFGSLVEAIHAAWTALGDGVKAPRAAELEIMRVARRSLVTRHALPRGHVIAHDDLAAKRPGTGISPMEVDRVVGRRLARAVPHDHLLHPEDLDPDRPGPP
jgi:N-acetylneuraminate synthase/N,N'-diacetyllegionaminate synthase